MSIPFIDLKSQYSELKDKINHRIQTVLDHGQFILGPEVHEFEERLKEYLGVKHAITCANGTDALLLAMTSAGIEPGDEVIVPGFSFIATAETVVLLGAKPVFVDIDDKTFNIDASKIVQAITPKTKAIIPVSLYGHPADMNEVRSLAEENGLTVIEDAAQSFGATYHGKKSCNLSTLATTSFFPAKPLGCYGDGGAVFTDNDELAEKIISLRFHGMSKEHRYKHIHVGRNSRLDTLQAAILIEKLAHFDWELGQRQKVARRYDEAFSQHNEKNPETPLQFPVIEEGCVSAYAQYTLWLENRSEIQAHLKEKGIPTAVHYPMPMYKQPAYESFFDTTAPSGNSKGLLEKCEWAARGVMSLPMHPYMSEETQNKIIDGVIETLSR